MNEQELIPEDWNAAEEVLARIVPDEVERNELRIEFARQHAQVSDHLFRLLYELRPPRNCREVWYLQLMSEEIDHQEFARLCAEHERQPLDLELIDSFYEELHERLGWLIKFWQAVFARSGDYELGRGPTVSAAQRDRYLREVTGPGSLAYSQIDAMVKLILQVRIRHNLGQTEWGEYSDACAHLLLATVRDMTRNRWKAIRDEVVQRLTANSALAFHPFEVYMKREWTGPAFFKLSGILRQEAAAVRLAFSSPSLHADSATEIKVVNHVHLEPTPITINNFMQTQVQESPKKQSTKASQEPRPPLNHKLNLGRWAVGLEDGNKWWLFHHAEHGWEQRGQVEIPGGKPHTLLSQIAENGGSIGRDTALNHFKLQYQGRLDNDIVRQVTYGMTDLRKAIRESIARAIRSEIPTSIDPIPKEGDGWRAAIQVGYAVQDDDGGLSFRFIKEG